jgi:hypothetical protein
MRSGLQRTSIKHSQPRATGTPSPVSQIRDGHRQSPSRAVAIMHRGREATSSRGYYSLMCPQRISTAPSPQKSHCPPNQMRTADFHSSIDPVLLDFSIHLSPAFLSGPVVTSSDQSAEKHAKSPADNRPPSPAVPGVRFGCHLACARPCSPRPRSGTSAAQKPRLPLAHASDR